MVESFNRKDVISYDNLEQMLGKEVDVLGANPPSAAPERTKDLVRRSRYIGILTCVNGVFYVGHSQPHTTVTEVHPIKHMKKRGIEDTKLLTIGGKEYRVMSNSCSPIKIENRNFAEYDLHVHT